MKKRIFTIILVLVLCLALLPAVSAAADYTSVKLNITGEVGDVVMNYNGFAMTGTKGEYETNWSNILIDSTGKTVYTGYIESFTSDGYYLRNFELLDSNFDQVLKFDPYKVTNDGQKMPAGVGISYEVVANGGVIAIVEDPIYFLDYSGNITGTYSGVGYMREGQVKIGADGTVTIFSYDWETEEWGYFIVDKTGKLLADLGMKFSNVGAFYGELTWAFEYIGDDEYKSYYIDKTGKIQLSLDAEYLYPFVDGYAVAGVGSKDNYQFGVIDKTGKWVIEPQYENMFGDNGVFAAQKGGKYGYVDINNNVLVPFEFNDLSSYEDGVGYGIMNGDLYAIKLDSTAGSPSSWAAAEVDAAIAAGLVPEHLLKNYTKPVSRGNVAQMFINLIEKASGESIDEFMAGKGVTIDNSAFTDTSDRAVFAANALGIIQGVGNNRFDPNGTLTRAQIAAIINRVARVIGVDTEGHAHGFTDVAGHWVSVELGWPVHAGIIKGESATSFNPNGNLTTEQAIAITYRALAPLS